MQRPATLQRPAAQAQHDAHLSYCGHRGHTLRVDASISRTCTGWHVSRASDGRGSVCRTADGRRWEGWVSVGIDPVTGKRARRHVRGRTKAEVQQKVDLLTRQGRSPTMHLDPRTTLSQWLDTWVELRSSAVRPNTLSGYRTDLLYVERSRIGRVALGKVTDRDIDALYDWVIASGCNRGTLEHLRRTLNPAFAAAVKRGYIAINPLLDVPLRGPRGHVGVPFDFGEISRLLLAARDCRNGARWDVSLLGLRQGEVLGLRWADVDLERAELTVRCSLEWRTWKHGCVIDATGSPVPGQSGCGKKPRWCPQRFGGGPAFADVKSAAGHRAVALPAPLVDRLREQRRRQAVERAAAGERWTEHDCVFATTTGTPIDRTTDREEWLALTQAAGLRQLRIHDLRHTAATALLLLGEDSRTIMAIMGWSAPSLVARYAHVVPDLRRRVATKQTAMFERPGPTQDPATDRSPLLAAAGITGGSPGGRVPAMHRPSRTKKRR